jgi:hypothetical protein
MEGLSCEGCGDPIGHTQPAISVRFLPDTWRRLWLTNTRRGWACTTCVSEAPASTIRTLLQDGAWHPYPKVDPPAPCEGCGQLISLRTDRPTNSGHLLKRLPYPGQPVPPHP